MYLVNKLISTRVVNCLNESLLDVIVNYVQYFETMYPVFIGVCMCVILFVQKHAVSPE